MNATAGAPIAPDDFIATVEPPARRDEARQLLALFADATGAEPFMSGPTIVGFGNYTYRYPSGHGGETLRVGFSPRKAAISLYGLKDIPELAPMLDKIGPHTEGAGCVYVKRLTDVDLDALRELASAAFAAPREHEVTE
jgi:hypothetical protein